MQLGALVSTSASGWFARLANFISFQISVFSQFIFNPTIMTISAAMSNFMIVFLKNVKKQ
jgi:hypothetical protein